MLAEVGADLFVAQQGREVRGLRDLALVHEQETLAALAQDVDVVRLVGVQAQEHQSAVAAVFFCAPASDFVTGQVLYLDGGITASQ